MICEKAYHGQRQRFLCSGVVWHGAVDAEAGNEEVKDGESEQIRARGHGEDEELVKREIPLHDPSKCSATQSADCTADADDGRHGG